MATTATSVETLEVVNSTTRKFTKGFENDVMRNRILLKRVKGAGNVDMNCSGDGVQWQPRRLQGTVQVNNGAQTVTHTQVNRFGSAFLDYVGYVIAESVTKREKLKNRGVPQIIDIFGRKTEMMMEDLEDKFSEELYIDSAATGNTGKLSGIETMMGSPTQTYTYTAGGTAQTPRSTNAADPVYVPLNTYAGVSTIPGNDGGSWSGVWPIGKGDTLFDYWSPVMIQGVSTFFGGGSTWATNALKAVRQGLIWSRRNKAASGGQANLALFDSQSFTALVELQDAKERVIVSDKTRGTTRYGNEEAAIFVEGCECTWEYGIPSGTGYGFNIDKLKLLSMQGTLFDDGDAWFWDRPSSSYRIAIDMLGQLQFMSPRHFTRWTTGL